MAPSLVGWQAAALAASGLQPETGSAYVSTVLHAFAAAAVLAAAVVAAAADGLDALFALRGYGGP